MRPLRRACLGTPAAEPPVDPIAANEVAAAYVDGPSRRDALTVAAYADLVSESDRLIPSFSGGAVSRVAERRMRGAAIVIPVTLASAKEVSTHEQPA